MPKARTPLPARAMAPDVMKVGERTVLSLRALATELGAYAHEVVDMIQALNAKHKEMYPSARCPSIPILRIDNDGREVVDQLALLSTWHAVMSPNLPRELLPETVTALQQAQMGSIVEVLRQSASCLTRLDRMSATRSKLTYRRNRRMAAEKARGVAKTYEIAAREKHSSASRVRTSSTS